ncbi:MAG: TolC family protein [Lentimicrobiaceae bacterium]|nr:TolC family protein [Lentimicrobiaceae bacterium]
MKHTLFFLLIFWGTASFAQHSQPFTLAYCIQRATDNSPLVKQRQWLPDAMDFKLKGLNINYMPAIYLNGQATLQSDITSIPVKIPGLQIEEMKKDQYKMTLDINQNVYDGGNTRQLKNIEKITLQVDQQKLEADLYQIKDKISQSFFTVLLLQENEKLLKVNLKDLQNKLDKTESGIRNGIVLPSNANILKAEMLRIEQQIVEIQEGRKGLLAVLGEMIGETIDDSTVFVLPTNNAASCVFENKRIEMNVFDMQMRRLDAMKSLNRVKTMPRLVAIGQAGYGRPGLDMFKADFDTYYLIGAKLSWNIWNWNQNKKDNQWLDVQKKIVESQKNNFNKNIKILSEQQKHNVSKYVELIEKDKEIIALRSSIVQTCSSQLDNGVITSTEYVTELNNMLQAKLNMESHKIQLEKSIADYLITNGIY